MLKDTLGGEYLLLSSYISQLYFGLIIFLISMHHNFQSQIFLVLISFTFLSILNYAYLFNFRELYMLNVGEDFICIIK